MINFFKKKKFEPQEIGKYYNEWTDRYIESFGDTFEAIIPENLPKLFDYYIAQSGMKDGMRILDAGCGVGGPSIYFATKLDVTIDAITVSSVQADILREKIAKANLKGTINVHVGDFHQIDKVFGNEIFDIVCFFESMVHSHDTKKLMKAVFAALKFGGHLYSKDLFKGIASTDKERDSIEKAVENANAFTYLNATFVDVVLTHAREAGLRLVYATDIARVLEIDYSVGNKFYARNNAKIYHDQQGEYTGVGPEYLAFYEIKAFKPYK